MDIFQKEFISLIQAAFTQKQGTVSDDFDWSKAVSLAKKHNIAAILYYGARNSGVSEASADMQELFTLTYKSMMVSQRQTNETKRILAAFEAEGIDHMPLKGTILKSLYPQPEMRTMGDADILIRTEQYGRIEEIMKGLGFTFRRETDHELVWVKPSLFLELHKRVMTTYNADFYRYFGDGWKIANRVNDSGRYEMSPEDFYIYLFVHFTKHYRISGIGIKHLLDLWVYSEAYPELNREYIRDEMKKMNLSRFYENVLHTINVWFRGERETDISDVITGVIFSSGQYGSVEMAVVNRALRDSKGSPLKIRLAKTVKHMFLPYQAMKAKYKVLEKLPFLLPIMWIVRWFDILFIRRRLFKRYMGEMKQINSQSVEENRDALQFVGLDFDFQG